MRYRNIVVLTGAGISQAAGLPTYRGPGGLWSNADLAALADVSAMRTRRAEACAMFWQFHQQIAKVEPTAAHRALAAHELTIITQNVDGLHQKAGSRNVIEYHGSLARWRCEQCGAEHAPAGDGQPRHCDEHMRPAAVLFGEMIPAEAEHAAKRALRDCDLFVAIGTSGTVWPAAGFVRSAQYAGAHTVLINLEIDDEASEHFAEVRAGRADEVVPAFLSSALGRA
ncbi:MAG TPA: Sir2 family NAD-dependent protein deacetylase [Kofleriaceae bacterium]|nr:Sir2 family NAD-dependent protein deacetylase [Kofleriaceae bacterium]